MSGQDRVKHRIVPGAMVKAVQGFKYLLAKWHTE